MQGDPQKQSASGLRTPSGRKCETPRHRHADYRGASSAGRIRSFDSAPRRAWPDRLPFPLSYGPDSGALVRRTISCGQRPHNHLGDAELSPSCLRMASHRRPSRPGIDRSPERVAKM